jgi:NADPH2:quinone reductase
MRALLCKEHGLPDRLELVDDWPAPQAEKGQVVIGIRAAGLNFPDVLIIQGKYQFQPEMPFVPGGECAGEVIAVGEGVDRYKVGDKVIAMTGHGCFCEQIAVDQHAVMPMPEGLDFTQAAGVAMTYFTSYHALKQRAKLKEGETLLVLGAAGGVGSTAVELGKMMGAKVIAAASSEEKLALCRELGADETINYSEQDLKGAIKELTGGKGVDVVYDPVGGDYAEPALRGMAWNGRYLVVGFAAGDIPEVPLNLALLKGCSIVGVFWGRFIGEEPTVHLQNIKDLWGLFAEGRLKPAINDVFALEDYAEAYDVMMGRRARGKVILTI